MIKMKSKPSTYIETPQKQFFALKYVAMVVLFATIATTLNPLDKPDFNCRWRNSWKGDIGEAPPAEEELPRHPRNILKLHSRKKRFISFPEGSRLTLVNFFSIPKLSTSHKSMSLFASMPFSIKLPEGTLSGVGTNLENLFGTVTDYGDDDDAHYQYIRKRSLDGHRKIGFELIETSLERFGFPGKMCLLNAVCEAAEEPTESYGLLGELLAVFLSAGYGGVMEEMEDYAEAEQIGRRNGTCDEIYKGCPFHLTDFLYSSISYMHHSLAGASNY